MATSSCFDMIAECVKQAAKVQQFKRTLRAIFRSILHVVQVLEDLTRELENGDDAGRDAERIHVVKSTWVADADEGEAEMEDDGIV